MSGLFRYAAVDISTAMIPLSGFGGRVTLCLNSATSCSFATFNMDIVRTFQDHYGTTAKGKTQVMLFPSSDFGHMEHLLPNEIEKWAETEHGVKVHPVSIKGGVFDNTRGSSAGACPVFLFGKCHVKTVRPNWGAPPFWDALGQSLGGASWNWQKYMIDAQGNPVEHLLHNQPWHDVKEVTDAVLNRQK